MKTQVSNTNINDKYDQGEYLKISNTKINKWDQNYQKNRRNDELLAKVRRNRENGGYKYK